MKLTDFSLLKEDDQNYTVGHPEGKSIQVSKKGLSEKAHSLISKLKRHQNFVDGGGTGDAEEEDKVKKQPEAPAEPEVQEIPMQTMAQPVQPLQIEPIAQEAPPTNEKPLVIEPIAEAEKTNSSLSSAPSQQEAAAKASADPYDSEQLLKKAIDSSQKATAQSEKDYGAAAASLQKAQKTTEQLTADYQVQDQAFLDAMEKKQVDPDRYLNNMSTGSKIASAIGLMISGIGAGIQGGENLALKQLNRAIDADIDAQKNDQSKTMNLWKMNREHYQNALAADLATKNQMITIAELKAKQAMASTNGAEVLARLVKPLAELQAARTANNQKLAVLAKLQQPTNGGLIQEDPSTMVATLVPESHQKEVFDEIKTAKNTAKQASTIMKFFDQAAAENTVLKTGAGWLRTPASVGAFHQALLPTFSEIDKTTKQGPMDETFKNLTPVPGDSDHTIAVKRKALEEYLQSKSAATTSKGFQLDLSKFANTNVRSQLYPPGSVVNVDGKPMLVGQ